MRALFSSLGPDMEVLAVGRKAAVRLFQLDFAEEAILYLNLHQYTCQ